MREDQQELNRQFEYIIRQMHSHDQNGEEDGLGDDEDGDDDEDDDEEDTAQMEVDIDRGDDITDNKENTLDGAIVGEILLKERFEKEKENVFPSANKRAGRSNMNSPLLPMPNKALSPQPPFANHNENDSIMNNNAGLLRRPSTPSRRRNSNITPSQIPKPAGSNRQSVPRKTPNRTSKVIEETHTKGRIGKAEKPDSPQTSSQKDSTSASESKKRVVENHPEYQKAFNSRPKILRTPEHKVGQSDILNSSSKPRPGSGKDEVL
ncbi:unnamed protein product [Rodentolepis nana]|uniref:Uncharacterized protein n=1 Tax=Rodentolepis nana TaxID=102285 RepID=A0A0R3TAE5_RODNA|nr:unnamed protein product [Rodentolepis nana]